MHTIDDYPGGRISWGDRAASPMDAGTIERYARRLLDTAIARGVEVIGLTPHAVYCDSQEDLSGVWRIVEVWSTETDESGVAYRDRIYAVFPGFEASMADGARGVHLKFLFDPQVGREVLVRAFHAVMDGVSPWHEGSLANAGRSASAAFKALEKLHRDDMRWDWLCLAPHAFASQQGVFGQLKSQMLRQFDHANVAGLELGDNQLPADAHRGRDWLRPSMDRYHHAFYHASDAYRLNPDPRSTGDAELGSRTTMFKLAAPTIEALRQAFLAADSRIRLTLAAGDSPGELVPARPVEAIPLKRPWLRSVMISGGSSFFGGMSSGTPRSSTFRLNPDLTCIIGGRMSGKSTLLDGLRVAFGFPLPQDPQVAKDVEGRGRGRFLAGSPAVQVDICGPIDPTADIAKRWPALFFTQRELQQAVSDQIGLRELLMQLLPGRAAELRSQFATVDDLARAIREQVPQLARAIEEKGDADQALAGAAAAKAGVDRHQRVGAGRLTNAQADVGRLKTTAANAGAALDSAKTARTRVSVLSTPKLETDVVSEQARDDLERELARRLATARRSIQDVITALEGANELLRAAGDEASAATLELRTEIEHSLVVEGGTAEELTQFVALSTTAQEYEARRLRAEDASTRLTEIRSKLTGFERDLARARADYSSSMRAVLDEIDRVFERRIHVKVIPNGIQDELESWVHSLKERGVTRWWNDLSRSLAPEEIARAADEDRLGGLGMSEQVAQTFRSVLTETRRWQLLGVHTPDRYELQLLVAPGEYRDMAMLSGGQQVSLLLSLLLETDDDRPIVIDQPEDELDKAYLFDVVLPALRRLKGVRQVIFVTHDANIVVNGDADLVIFLDAGADHGWIATDGAIEEATVREAILTVLDGGEKAFELRSRKYGF